MEFRDYLALIKPYIWFIIALPILFAIAGYVGTLRQPPKFEASTTLTVEKPQAASQAATNYYQYDEYYSQLAATLFADTIANWLRSPGPVVEVYEEAGLTPPQGGAARVAQTFRVGKGSNTTVITVTIQDASESNAAKLAESAKSVVNRKVGELRLRNNDPNYFFVDMTAAKVFEATKNPLIIAILGAVSGFMAALVLVFLFLALRPAQKR